MTTIAEMNRAAMEKRIQAADPKVRDVFLKLRREAKLVVCTAEWAAFPDEDETETPDFNIQSALDHAHSLLDLVHELKEAIKQ